MNIKEIFKNAENGTLTFDEFMAAAKEGGAKFCDLSEGNYVAKSKYTDDLKAKDEQIETLNTTISTRDTDLADLKTKLEKAGTNVEKITSLTNDLTALQGKYDTDTKNFKDQIAHQAYEFAVKEFASTKNFTSNAAKRDFINSLISENLKLDNNKIMGADDFVTKYTQSNADAFVVEEPEVDPTPTTPKPTFVNPTGGTEPNQDSNPFHFSFTGVRAHEE